jgi:hypothetical protein
MMENSEVDDLSSYAGQVKELLYGEVIISNYKD